MLSLAGLLYQDTIFVVSASCISRHQMKVELMSLPNMQQSVQTCRERSKKELFCTSLFRASYINPYTCVCRFYPCGLLIFTPRGLSLRRLDKFNSYNAIPTNWILLPQRKIGLTLLFMLFACLEGGGQKS